LTTGEGDPELSSVKEEDEPPDCRCKRPLIEAREGITT